MKIYQLLMWRKYALLYLMCSKYAIILQDKCDLMIYASVLFELTYWIICVNFYGFAWLIYISGWGWESLYESNATAYRSDQSTNGEDRFFGRFLIWPIDAFTNNSQFCDWAFVRQQSWTGGKVVKTPLRQCKRQVCVPNNTIIEYEKLGLLCKLFTFRMHGISLAQMFQIY